MKEPAGTESRSSRARAVSRKASARRRLTAADFLSFEAARRLIAMHTRTPVTRALSAGPRVGGPGGVTVDDTPLPPSALVDERLSGRRTNADNRAWLDGRFNWLDGGSGRISLGAESTRLTVILNSPTLGRGYLVQARIIVHNDFPRDPIRIVVSRGVDDRGTNSFVHLSAGAHVLPAFVIPASAGAKISFLGGATVYTVIDLRVQRLTALLTRRFLS